MHSLCIIYFLFLLHFLFTFFKKIKIVGKLPNIRGHRLFVCDIGGQLKSLWQSYFPECHGIIFLIDTSDKENFPKSVETFGNFFFFLFLKKCQQI